jgi:hypothetical protein
LQFGRQLAIILGRFVELLEIDNRQVAETIEAIPVICCFDAFLMAISGNRNRVLRRCADGMEFLE